MEHLTETVGCWQVVELGLSLHSLYLVVNVSQYSSWTWNYEAFLASLRFACALTSRVSNSTGTAWS